MNQNNAGQFPKKPECQEETILAFIKKNPCGESLSTIGENMDCSESGIKIRLKSLKEKGLVTTRNIGTEQKPRWLYIAVKGESK